MNSIKKLEILTKKQNATKPAIFLTSFFLLVVFLPIPVFATTSGPNSAGTGANDTSFGSLAWTNPANATSSNNVYATRALSSSTDSNYLKATNFGFSIPSGATINGITVEIERKAAALISATDVRVRIVKSDGTVGTTTDKADTSITWPTTDTFKTYGGSG